MSQLDLGKAVLVIISLIVIALFIWTVGWALQRKHARQGHPCPSCGSTKSLSDWQLGLSRRYEYRCMNEACRGEAPHIFRED